MGPALRCSAPRINWSLLSSCRTAVVLLERSGSHGGVLAAPFSPLFEEKIGPTCHDLPQICLQVACAPKECLGPKSR